MYPLPLDTESQKRAYNFICTLKCCSPPSRRRPAAGSETRVRGAPRPAARAGRGREVYVICDVPSPPVLRPFLADARRFHSTL